MRQFLAAPLAGPTRDALRGLRDGLRHDHDGWRWLEVASVHLTLRFLGEVDAQTDRVARDGWRRVAAAAERFRFRLGGLGRFPASGRARVLWVGVDEDAGRLAPLAAALERQACELGFAAESRGFRPHLTIARARRGARPRAPESPPPLALEQRVDEVVLYRSDLHPAGARYTALESFPLGDAQRIARRSSREVC